jgi:hypothetical protein
MSSYAMKSWEEDDVNRSSKRGENIRFRDAGLRCNLPIQPLFVWKIK